MKNEYDFQETKFQKEMISTFIKDFFTQAKNLATCPHCNEVKLSVKKEGTNKFVLKEKEKQ